MVDTSTKQAIGVLLTMILGFTYFGLSDVEPTHYCLERELKAHCITLSSTAKTCYTLPANQGGKRCDQWKEIPFIIEEIKVASRADYERIYKCDNINCTMIRGEI